MGSILEAYEKRHGTREESLDPNVWDVGLSNFEDGWLEGLIWGSNSVSDREPNTEKFFEVLKGERAEDEL
jgi:hypothetical protein